MLKEEVIDAALEKVLADEDLTLASALRVVAEAKHPEEQFAYQRNYGMFMTTVGRINNTQRREDVYTELARRFVEFLRKNNLLEETVAVPAPASAAGYREDEFDFSDWEGIRRASGF